MLYLALTNEIERGHKYEQILTDRRFESLKAKSKRDTSHFVLQQF
jgi:hypothetical protein